MHIYSVAHLPPGWSGVSGMKPDFLRIKDAFLTFRNCMEDSQINWTVHLLWNHSLPPKRFFSLYLILTVNLTNMVMQSHVIRCSQMTQKEGLNAVGGQESLRVLQHCTQVLELCHSNRKHHRAEPGSTHYNSHAKVMLHGTFKTLFSSKDLVFFFSLRGWNERQEAVSASLYDITKFTEVSFPELCEVTFFCFWEVRFLHRDTHYC